MSEESKKMLEKVLSLYNEIGIIIDPHHYYLSEDDDNFYKMVLELETLLGVKLEY